MKESLPLHKVPFLRQAITILKYLGFLLFCTLKIEKIKEGVFIHRACSILKAHLSQTADSNLEGPAGRNTPVQKPYCPVKGEMLIKWSHLC